MDPFNMGIHSDISDTKTLATLHWPRVGPRNMAEPCVGRTRNSSGVSQIPYDKLLLHSPNDLGVALTFFPGVKNVPGDISTHAQ